MREIAMLRNVLSKHASKPGVPTAWPFAAQMVRARSEAQPIKSAAIAASVMYRMAAI
jgi:hypothetical protein